MKNYKIEMYGISFSVMTDPNDFFKFCKKAKVEIEDDIKLSGCCITSGDFIGVYIDKDEIKTKADLINTIAHESFHVVDYISEYFGLRLNEGTGNEHIAYLIGYVNQKVYEFCNKEGLI